MKTKTNFKGVSKMTNRFNNSNILRMEKERLKEFHKRAKRVAPKVKLINLPAFPIVRDAAAKYYNESASLIGYSSVLAYARHVYTNYDELCSVFRQHGLYNTDEIMNKYRYKFDEKIKEEWRLMSVYATIESNTHRNQLQHV